MLKMNFIVLVVCLVVLIPAILVVDAEISENQWNFMNILSGFYINNGQIEKEKEKAEVKEGRHDLMSVLYLPVEIPWLAPDIPFYFEEVLNHNISRMQIFAIREVDGVIKINQYNISTNKSYRPGEFEKTDFSKISLQPLNKKCPYEFLNVGYNMYLGTYTDCTSFIETIQEYPKYAITSTCPSISGMIYYEISRESRSLLPYVLPKKKWFELPPSVTEGVNYTNPCDNKLNQE